MSELPGIKAAHAIISDTCRRNRTSEGAIDEALRRLKVEYMEVMKHRESEQGVEYHVALTVHDTKA